MAKTKEETKSAPAAADAPRKRGRPPGSGSGVKKVYVPTGKPRGRPRTTEPKVPSGRPRGRPKGSFKNPADRKTPVKPAVPSGRPRGRPKGSFKNPADRKTPIKPKSTGTGKRGRPRKIDGPAKGATAAVTAAKSSPAKPRGRSTRNSLAAEAAAGSEDEKVDEDEDDEEVDADDDNEEDTAANGEGES